jgi:O-succinylbenzoic acid--CoA ligase
MESPAHPFDLEELRRDWIVSVMGGDFFRAVEENLASLEGPDRSESDPSVVLTGEEPVAFAARFFAAAYLNVPIILANPNWGQAERVQFEYLMRTGPLERGMIAIPTGGTSGGVKLAVHSWDSLTVAADALSSFIGGAPIHSCCMLPLYHVSGLMQLIRSFASGGRIRFDDAEVSGYCISLVPTQLQRALQDKKCIRKLNTARAIFVGGAALPKEVETKARELRLPIVPVYGMTETAAMVAAVPPRDFMKAPGAGAVSLGDAKFSIEGDGRVRIRTSALFRGYLGQPPLDLTEGFVVNDEGRVDNNGRLHILGRMDRLVNTGGEKVDPREVEAALLELETVSEALVVGVPDAEWGEIVVAYVAGPCDGKDTSWFRKRLEARLASYKLPKDVRVVDALPLDARGKYRISRLAGS